MEIKTIKIMTIILLHSRRLKNFVGAANGSVERETLEHLIDLVEAYEQIHFPVDTPDKLL